MQLIDIKQHLSIQSILQYYGLIPDHHHRLLCPFHTDKNTRSLQIYYRTNTFYCFGCRKTGDVIDFIKYMDGCSKYQAIKKAENFIRDNKFTSNNKASQIIPGSQKMNYTILFKSFRQNLFKYPKAQVYCNKRKLNYKNLDIGYNPGYNFDKLKYCIIFPLKDNTRNITGFYGRSIINNKNSRHFYLSGRKGLYPNYPKSGTIKLILTEAIIDAAILLQLKDDLPGFEILSLFGTNGLKNEHIHAIEQLPKLKEILLFFDGDYAAGKAIERYTKELQKITGAAFFKVNCPNGEDINSLYIKYGKQSLIKLINQAQSIINNQKSIIQNLTSR